MVTGIQKRKAATVYRDAAASWASLDPVLAVGEIGIETDTGIVRFGDGVTAFANLPAHERLTADSKARTATAALDFGSIAAGATAELTISVTGATTGAAVALGPPAALEAGLVATGYVSAAGTVTVRLHNTTGGAIDPAAATWRATVFNG